MCFSRSFSEFSSQTARSSSPMVPIIFFSRRGVMVETKNLSILMPTDKTLNNRLNPNSYFIGSGDVRIRKVLKNTERQREIHPRVLFLKGFGPVQKMSSCKAAAFFARGAYLLYVSAHGPKRAESVSPKVRKNGDLPARSRSGEGRERRWPVCRSLGEGWRLFSTGPTTFGSLDRPRPDYNEPDWGSETLRLINRSQGAIPRNRITRCPSDPSRNAL